MTKRDLIDSLKQYPDDADIILKNIDSDTRYNICFVSWKNSSERVILNFNNGEN